LSAARTGGVASAFDAAWHYGGLGLISLALLMAMGWGLSRSTTYSLTTSHLVMEYGMALPKTITIPYARIASAGFRPHADGTGDIALTLGEGRSVAYFLMWPHARPWHLARTVPMLRALPDAEQVAQIVARALAASADMAPVAVSQPEAVTLAGGAAAAAA
jgi:hypothetical protein